MIYLYILLGVVGGALVLAILVRVLGAANLRGANISAAGFVPDIKKYGSQFKMIVTVMLLIFVLAILFPDSRPLFFGNPTILLAFFGVLGIFFLNFSLGGSQTVTNLAKVFAWGVIAYIVFTVLVDPYVNFNDLGEKINRETERIERSYDPGTPEGAGLLVDLPPSRRFGSHTQTSPVKISPEGRLEFVKVQIDGTNEFDKYPLGKRMGHDTTMTLDTGECVEVEYVTGVLGYLYQNQSGEWKIGHPQMYSGIDGWSSLGGDYTAFYPYDVTRNSVLLVLWTRGDYKVFPIPQAHTGVAGCNPFSGNANVFLFFNTPELLRDRVTAIQEDMFGFNGWDGSRAVFDVKLCEETIEDMGDARYADCKR